MRWCRGDLVDFQVVLVPSQVVNANPSDSQVYDAYVDAAYFTDLVVWSVGLSIGLSFSKSCKNC